jgi:hypothetical protein
MNATLRPNIAERSFAGETERELPHSDSYPEFPGLPTERHNVNLAWNADRYGVATPGFGFAGQGVPFSPLHDV